VTRQVRQFVAFVASPGDLPRERDALRRAAQSVNDAIGRRFGLSIVIEGWEQVQPALGRPQAVINPRVNDCDIFIGLLSRRWGTPTGVFSSGFEEEYERALELVADGRPAIGLFFRELSEEEVDDAGKQLQQVLAFQERVREQRIALYATFQSTEELELKLQTFLSDFLAEQISTSQQPPAKSESTVTASSHSSRPAVAGATSGQDDDIDDARQQIVAALRAWSDVVLGRPPSELLDRDRLLSFAVAVGHDQAALPTHVANRLFRRRDSLHLSAAEATSWLRAFCDEAGRVPDHFWGRFVPGWYFFAADEELAEQLVALAQDDVWLRARGAVVLLTALGSRPAMLWPPMEQASVVGDAVAVVETQPGSAVTALWAELLDAGSTGAPTLQYLHDAASPTDTALLESLASAADGQSWAIAVHAVIAAVGGDRQPALEHLIAHPYSPAAWVVSNAILAVPDANQDRLLALLEARHTLDSLRARAFDELLARDALDDGTGPAAVAVMLRRSDATRAHLLDRPYSAVDGRLRTWLQLAWSSLSKDDRAYGVDERVDALTREPQELLSAATPNVLGLGPWRALSIQGAPSLADRAREVLRSGGIEFTEGIRHADDPDMTSVRTFVAASGRAAALRMLAAIPKEQRQPGDVELARAELARDEFITQEGALHALATLAEPEDVLELVQALPTALRRHRTESVLRRVVELGGAEAARRLVADEDDGLAETGARALAGDASIAASDLVELLYDGKARVRRAALAGLVGRLEADALTELLDGYAERTGTHYYDVIAALDWQLNAPEGVGKGLADDANAGHV
jgi:hypothetical protein